MHYGQWPGITCHIHELWAVARNYKQYTCTMGNGQELDAISMNYGQWPEITGSISMNYGQWPGIVGIQ